MNLLSQDKYKKGPKFQADATNGYYAIPLWPEHTYKTAFSCNLGQFCYNVMGQGLTGAPHTYSRMKDIAMGTIPEPNEEDALHGDHQVEDGDIGFDYFMDDDYGVASSFNALFSFLHERYFPRINWARLTLKPSKTRFFCNNIELLGYELQPEGLRPSVDKIAKFRDYPSPRNEEELDKFLYMTTYLRRYIPGRADHARQMKQAVVYIREPVVKTKETDHERQTKSLSEEHVEGEKKGTKEAGSSSQKEVGRSRSRQNKRKGQPVMSESSVDKEAEGKIMVARKIVRDTKEKGGIKQVEGYDKDPISASAEERMKGRKKRGRMTWSKRKMGWQWGKEQEESFQWVKRSIIERATTGGDVNKQYHLSCDASQTGLGSVLFQLSKSPPGTILTSKLWGEVQVVML